MGRGIGNVKLPSSLRVLVGFPEVLLGYITFTRRAWYKVVSILVRVRVF